MALPWSGQANLASRRRIVVLLMALVLVSQLLLGSFAQALPCTGGMPDCGDCPHMQTTAHENGSTSVPSTDCAMHQAGVCSGLHVTASTSAVTFVAPPIGAALQAREPSVPPLEGPPFELLRPPQR